MDLDLETPTPTPTKYYIHFEYGRTTIEMPTDITPNEIFDIMEIAVNHYQQYGDNFRKYSPFEYLNSQFIKIFGVASTLAWRRIKAPISSMPIIFERKNNENHWEWSFISREAQAARGIPCIGLVINDNKNSFFLKS